MATRNHQKPSPNQGNALHSTAKGSSHGHPGWGLAVAMMMPFSTDRLSLGRPHTAHCWITTWQTHIISTTSNATAPGFPAGWPRTLTRLAPALWVIPSSSCALGTENHSAGVGFNPHDSMILINRSPPCSTTASRSAGDALRQRGQHTLPFLHK